MYSRIAKSILAVMLFTAAAHAETVDMVVAAIDGEPITAGDLKRFIVAQGQSVPANFLVDVEASRAIVRDMVTAMLLEKEAEKNGIAVGDDELKAYIEEIKRQNQVDDEGLEELLQTRHLTLAEYKKQVVSDILRTRVISSKVRSRITIVDQDIDRYLAEHPELMPKVGEVRVEQIFIVAGDSPEEKREEATKMRERILAGEKFSAVGGETYQDLGYVKLADLRPELKSAVEASAKEATSEVVAAGDGFYLVHAASDIETASVPKEIREQIRNQLAQQRVQGELDRYMREELQKKYDVEIKI